MTLSERSLDGLKPRTAESGAGRLHWLVTLLTSFAFAGNGASLAAISYGLPGLRLEWNLSPMDVGLVFAAYAAGQVCGSLVGGWLADRLGRRLAFASIIAYTGVVTGLVALSPTPLAAAVLLFAAGLGMSGIAPVAVSLVSEFAAPARRGEAMALTQVFWAFGFVLMAAGGTFLADGIQWRWVFGLGTLPILLAVFAWRLTPESPRYLLAHGRRAEAEALARDLEARYGVPVPLPEQQRASRRSNPFRNLAELWGPRFRRPTMTIWFTWFVMVAAFNGPILWLPTLLISAGAAPQLSAQISFIIALFHIPASFISLLLIERVGRRRLLIASLAFAAGGTLALAIGGPQLQIILGGGLLAGGVLSAWPVMLGYCGELYPTRVRATAAGWASMFSRSGGVVAPLLLGQLLGSWGTPIGLALGVFVVLLALAVLLVMVLGEETAGRSLEELSG